MKGHTESVFSVCTSKDGNKIISGSADELIIVWDMNTHKKISQFEGHNDTITSVCMSADGNMIISASKDSTIRFWCI